MSDISPELTIRAQKTDSGIPKEIKGKILQPFFTTKKGTEGTGLGLGITNNIIKAHGGYMGITSKEGQGSTFTTSLSGTKA